MSIGALTSLYWRQKGILMVKNPATTIPSSSLQTILTITLLVQIQQYVQCMYSQ